MKPGFISASTTSTRLILAVASFLMLSGNLSFFRQVTLTYPLSWHNGLFIFSLAFTFGAVIVLLLSLVNTRYTLKPVLIITLLASSLCAYFMDTYNVIIDDTMIENILSTNLEESKDLLSYKLFLYLIFIGVIPSILVFNTKVHYSTIKTEIINRGKFLLFSILVLVIPIAAMSDFYASFFREHKILRAYSNPGYIIYSAFKYAGNHIQASNIPFIHIGLDAKIPESDTDRELVIMVVGETARADRFSINGYHKKTNPYLETMHVVSYTQFKSCGTTTAVSVPCMFSFQGQDDYDKNTSDNTDNILDILQRSGVNVLWLDNNSDSKGVAARAPYQDYKNPALNPVCDIECRDIGMLSHLQTYINNHPDGDILIVLHQMGSHGPAYYKRYPKAFEKFTPVCKTNQLEQCSSEEINNTYDNTILYTDYFLSEVIKLLKENDEKFETAMVYMSDHGESLGENNLYLHGLPYFIAPDTQKNVPVIMWFGKNIIHEINLELLEANTGNTYTHDNLFHTLLGIMEVGTELYDKNQDMIEHVEDD